MYIDIVMSNRLLTLAQCTCAVWVTIVGCVWACACVCVSVNQHLTSGASVPPESNIMYSTGNEVKICVYFS